MSSVLVWGQNVEGAEQGSHWEEALVAIVETQCCWKLGDMAELQPSLWRGPFRPPSPSTIQGLPPASLPSTLQQAGGAGAGLGACVGAEGPSGAWAWRTVVMWVRRSLKNSETPS